MTGITLIETPVLEALINGVKKSNDLLTQIASAAKVEDNYLSIDEASQYLGFGKSWISERQEEIGYYQDGKDRRFKRADLDAYMANHFIKRKTK